MDPFLLGMGGRGLLPRDIGKWYNSVTRDRPLFMGRGGPGFFWGGGSCFFQRGLRGESWFFHHALGAGSWFFMSTFLPNEVGHGFFLIILGVGHTFFNIIFGVGHGLSDIRPGVGQSFFYQPIVQNSDALLPVNNDRSLIILL